MSKTAKDHWVAVVKAGLNSVPVVGGTVASLLSDYLPTATEKALDQFSKSFGDELSRIQSRLDAELVSKDDFVELFKTVYMTVNRTHKVEKLRGAARILSNVMLREGDNEKLTYSELDHYARALEAFSFGALEVLSKLTELAEEREAEVGHPVIFSIPASELQKHLPRYEISFLLGLSRELVGWNFADIQVPAVRDGNDRNYPIEITELGRSFVRHVLAQSDESDFEIQRVA